jgi:hypothetical protein
MQRSDSRGLSAPLPDEQEQQHEEATGSQARPPVEADRATNAVPWPSESATHAAHEKAGRSSPSPIPQRSEQSRTNDGADGQSDAPPGDGSLPLISSQLQTEQAPLPPEQETMVTIVPQYGQTSPSDDASEIDEDGPEAGEIIAPEVAQAALEHVDHMDVDHEAAGNHTACKFESV